MPPHQLGGAHRGLDVIDGEHEHLGALGARGAQQVQPRSVAVVDLVAEAAHEVDVLRRSTSSAVNGMPAHAQDAADDLPDAAEARDDDAAVLALDARRTRAAPSS